MIEFLAGVAAEIGWAIPVAVVLWFIARRTTRIVPATTPTTTAREKSFLPGWQRAVGLVAAAAALWALMIGLGWLIATTLEPVRDMDVAIIEGLVASRTDPLTFLAHIGDQIGNTPGIIAMAIIAAAAAHGVTRRWSPALVVVAAAAGETSIFLATQLAISRARPDVEQLAGEPATSSFPSGHVAATIATYGCIALLVLAWSRSAVRVVAVTAAIALPLLVAWARMYQGMHFPSDVLASFLFAPLWLAACWWAIRPHPKGETVRIGRAADADVENAPAPAR
uniref:phosphatase PAP2 family protein n=1 Tax=Microcella sp. TaxID=1913979 RepID=UPI00272A1DB8|nr:phosphatase PAP2 family protein [Microcella sp.]